MLAASWSAFERAGMLQPATWYEALRSEPSAAHVMIDAPGQLLLDGIVSTDWSALYRVDLWPAVRSGDRITQGAMTFEVREVLAVGDGALARAALRRLDR
jgi:hypothetical protein